MECKYFDCLNDATFGKWCSVHFPLSAEAHEIELLINMVEDAEARRDALRAENSDLISEVERLNSVIYHHIEQRDELAAQLATAQAERDAAYRVLRSIRGWARLETPDPHEREAFVAWCDQALPEDQRLAAFERMAPLDWRTDDETPLGHMLDGIGDEVEP